MYHSTFSIRAAVGSGARTEEDSAVTDSEVDVNVGIVFR